jgi:DNA-binding SARP family transcriptional activator/tetratricopeptide (TPR) repeat protein
MQVRLLGPVDVLVDGVPRLVLGRRRKALLAILALHDGAIVGTDWLVDAMYGETASPGSVSTLQSHVSVLRGLLGSKTSILARPPGYALQLSGGDTDAQQAERLLRAGSGSTDPARGVRDLEAALALWRGRPLADVSGIVWLEEQAERLELLGSQVKRALSQARLAAGEHVQLIPDLEQMAAEFPLDEQVGGQLMLALYRSGRQADALAVYYRLRCALDEQLGIYPGSELRELEMSILRQDPALDASVRPVVKVVPSSRPTPAPASTRPVPAQLPPAVPGFAGRAAELASLDSIAFETEPDDRGRSAAVPICVVSGTAGVGKTALAVHWAQRVAGRFPDGQLYVNLRGFDPGGSSVEPAEAMRGFLDALGVPEARIPDGLQAQAALYRSLLAGRRMMVVLDNARSEEQVRPLLPGSSGCLAVLTSRHLLAGLVVAEGAVPLPLDVLGRDDACDLLVGRLGRSRVESEPEAVAEIIGRCAGLPLALAVVAARACVRPAFPLTAVAADLRVSSRALDPFGGDDAATDVRGVLSWSYRALSDAAARLFRLLGLHPGPDITVAAAASLAAAEPARTRLLLTELVRAHLIAEHAPGRFACHDLLRAYADELARACDSDRDREVALGNVIDHYLHTSRPAALRFDPYLESIDLAPPGPEVIVGVPATAETARAWFTSEQSALIAAVRCAAEVGLDTRAWQLAWSLSAFLLRRGLWHENATVQRIGLMAARRCGDAVGEAHALNGLASCYVKSGRDRESRPFFTNALLAFEKVGDHAGQGHIHSQLGWLAERRNRPAEMLDHCQQSLRLFRAAGHRAGVAVALNDVGYSHAMVGDYRQALDYCERSLAALTEFGERSWEEATWDSLGYIHHQLGNHSEAIACYQRSIDLCRQIADRYNEAATLDHLGDVQLSAGDQAAACRTWTGALAIFDEIDHPDAKQVRRKLMKHGLALGSVKHMAIPIPDVARAFQRDWSAGSAVGATVGST